VEDNMLFDYLIENYEKGEPIFLADIHIEGMTEENIRYHLKKLTDDGVIGRFESGIYYLPKMNIFGEKSALSAETVALHKYVLRKGKRVGFYSGYTLANRLGLSTQVPFKEEITSNYAPAQVREISIKNRKYVIRRPAIEITEKNAYALQLLDCLKDIDKSAEEDMKVCGKILSQYARQHRITKEQVDQLLEYYPIKIYKAIYETGVEYVSA
jgi:predicted transcriptional regulator of viral defense system